MGRKIPAKKHRGVKDPVLQQIKRLESLKGKINAPPKDPDEQPVPRSLTRLFAFQEQKRKSLTIINKKCKQVVRDKDDRASSSVKNPLSILRKLPGESGREFSLRINNAVRALHNPAEELNYPLDNETEDVKGMRMAEQRERRAKKRRNNSNVAHRAKDDEDTEPQLTRTQKIALKRKAKKMKASEANKERHEVVYDRVTFGEVSHAPPTLQFRSKGNTGAPRPGRRDLLLNALLPGNNSKDSNESNNKCKAASAAAELRRRDVVAAYRALKASNLNKTLPS